MVSTVPVDRCCRRAGSCRHVQFDFTEQRTEGQSTGHRLWLDRRGLDAFQLDVCSVLHRQNVGVSSLRRHLTKALQATPVGAGLEVVSRRPGVPELGR